MTCHSVIRPAYSNRPACGGEVLCHSHRPGPGLALCTASCVTLADRPASLSVCPTLVTGDTVAVVKDEGVAACAPWRLAQECLVHLLGPCRGAVVLDQTLRSEASAFRGGCFTPQSSSS